MRKLLLLAILTFSMTSQAQNLVENGGFEPDDCVLPAYYINEICPPWDVSSDAGYWADLLTRYFGPCTSSASGIPITPRTGDGAIGFPVYGEPNSTDVPHESRGYPIGTLKTRLNAGTVYQISYWVHAAYVPNNGVQRGTNAPGVLFVSDTSRLPFNNLYVMVSENALYPDEPMLDYDNWVQVCMQYEAKGNEKFIILGNFRTNANSDIQYLNPAVPPTNPDWDWGYYVVDDLSVIADPGTPAALPETADICPESTIELTANAPSPGVWEDGSTNTTRTITEPGTYAYTYLDGACYRTDATVVSLVNCQECYVYLANAFTPNGDGENDTWKPIFQCDVDYYLLEVYDRIGNLVFQTRDPEEAWSPESSVREGVYVARVQFTYQLYGNGELIDKHTELVVLK